MDESLKGKVAAITGAASGIGLACTRALLAAGAKVVLIDRAEDRLSRLTAELGPDAMPLTVDLLQPAEASGLLPRILDLAGSGLWEGDLAVVREDRGVYRTRRRGSR